MEKFNMPKFAYEIGFNLDKSRNIKEINHYADTFFNSFAGCFSEDQIVSVVDECSNEFGHISKNEIDVRKVRYNDSGKIIWGKSGDQF